MTLTRSRAIAITRVLVDADGTAVPPWQADEHGVTEIDVVCIRKDGWVLAAPASLRDQAVDMWIDEWEHVLDLKPSRPLEGGGVTLSDRERRLIEPATENSMDDLIPTYCPTCDEEYPMPEDSTRCIICNENLNED